MQKQPCLRLCRYYLQGYCRFGHNYCYLVRHAKSQFNQKRNNYFQHIISSPFQQQSYQFSLDLVDCRITEDGIKQIADMELLELRNHANIINIDGIFVSPLERALQTAHQMIKIHNIKVKQVIVLANLTQVLSKICDFMGPINQTIKKYPNFNFSYFLNSITSMQQNWQDTLVQSNYQHQININESNGLRYLSLLKKIFPQPLENQNHCYNRAMQVINEIKQICIKLQLNKIMVVSHNRILKYISGKDLGGKVPELLNCQMRHIYI